MGYTVVKSFERGLDTRRLIDTTEPGALLEARDCHISLGGEIEKRAAFISRGILPATTHGFFVTEGRVWHVWGDILPAPALPPGTIYHYVPNLEGGSIERVLSVEEFNGGIYSVVQYHGGIADHWWWMPGFAEDHRVNVPANDPVVGGGPPPDTSPANKPQVNMRFALVTAGGIPVSNVTVVGVYLLAPASTYTWGTDAWLIIPQTGVTSGTDPWPVGNSASTVVTTPNSPNQVAAKVMSLVNSFVAVAPQPAPPVEVSAQAGEDGQIQFWVVFAGPTYNNWTLQIALDGPCRCIPNNIMAFTGGTAETTTSSLGSPIPYVGLPGDPIRKGPFARAHARRMFAVNGSLLSFSAPENATLWDKPAAETGFIEHSQLTNRAPRLMSMADYGTDFAVLALRHIFIWYMDVSPTLDRLRQILHGTGTFAPHSAVPFGTGDVMYLDVSGIRSLQARDSSTQAFAADIGHLIDNLVLAQISTLTEDQKKWNVWGIVEPRSGRLWMAINDKIFVLSHYPSNRISAWSWYDASTAPVDYMCTSDNSVYWRSVNTVYIYGGETGNQYDDTQAVVRIPYVDGGKPATLKNWAGIDLALTGRWQVRGSFDPTNPAALDLLANLDKSTYAQQKIAVNGESPALSLELTSSDTWFGRARIGNATVHFSDSNAD